MNSGIRVARPPLASPCAQSAPGSAGAAPAIAAESWDIPDQAAASPCLAIRLATEPDRESIYRLRHEVYARELRQHPANESERLTDSLDAFNTYLVVAAGDRIVGFVSITPPGSPRFSIDKYLAREQLPFAVDDGLFEVRLLTVPNSSRRSLLALALMYASFRWVEAHSGTRIMAIGRREIMSMYQRVGLKPVGVAIQSGAVAYELMTTTMPEVHEALAGIGKMLERIEQDMDWQLGMAYRTPAPCYHGGSFFEGVGEEFNALERLESIINADVLDAWFPPSPKVVESLRTHLPRLLHTSPPVGAGGLVRTIARTRGVRPESVLPGAGSSDLIFLALRHWLTRRSRALILDPSYGEYAHVLEQVVGCEVDRLTLTRPEQYRLDPARLEAALRRGYDLVVLVNPNSPTGQHLPRRVLERVLEQAPDPTRIWVDETYVEYVGPHESLERFAARSRQVIVCKSMSKTYALSGVRAAYLCAHPHQLEGLRSISPPWAVSLPAQVAAVRALLDPEYYAARHHDTHVLREELRAALAPLRWDILPSTTNFLLCHLPEDGPTAAALVQACRAHGLFLRDAASMGRALGERALRIAVKDAPTNRRMVEILKAVRESTRQSPRRPPPSPGGSSK